MPQYRNASREAPTLRPSTPGRFQPSRYKTAEAPRMGAAGMVTDLLSMKNEIQNGWDLIYQTTGKIRNMNMLVTLRVIQSAPPKVFPNGIPDHSCHPSFYTSCPPIPENQPERSQAEWKLKLQRVEQRGRQRRRGRGHFLVHRPRDI